MRGIVDLLRSMANVRFGFGGQVLSAEGLCLRPTHLVLQYHSTSPTSVSYTLSDVLTWMQSTLVPQWVLSLLILYAILRCHDDVVFNDHRKPVPLAWLSHRFGLCILFLLWYESDSFVGCCWRPHLTISQRFLFWAWSWFVFWHRAFVLPSCPLNLLF